MIVCLNGLDFNPYTETLGLTANPFPQIPVYEYSRFVTIVQELGATPIPNTDYIRNHLRGFSEEFINLCCECFCKGEYIEFEVVWKDDNDR
jgi:hypothetical protein